MLLKLILSTGGSLGRQTIDPIRPPELFNGELGSEQHETTDAGDTQAAGGQLKGAGEAVRTKVPKSTPAPTQAEVDAHRLSGHAVYRSWCSSCGRGKGQSGPHKTRTQDDERGDVPVVSIDYGYLGTKNDDEDVEDEQAGNPPLLVIHDSKSGSILAYLKPTKGVQWEGSEVVLRRVLKSLDWLVYRRIVCKCDNEAAMAALARVIQKA